MAKPPARAEALADTIARQIHSGHPPAGGWLPPERELSEVHGVARSTVRHALEILQTRGLVERRDGSGVRVRGERGRRNARDVTRQEGHWRGFHVSMTQQGQQPYTRTTITAHKPADPLAARYLGVPAGTPVLERARIQGVLGEPPKQLSITWYLPAVAELLPVLSEVDTGPGGMHSRMEEIGLALHFEEVVTCRRANATEAIDLEYPLGDPVCVFWRRCYDQNDRVVEVTYRIVPGDRQEQIYQFEYRLP